MTFPTLDEGELDRAFRQFATGVILVLANDGEGNVIAAQARAFNSVSLDPPLLLWSLDKEAFNFAGFRSVTHFALHVLAEDQVSLIDALEARAAPDVSGADWTPHAELHLPIHGRCAAWFACEQVDHFDADDHGIFVGHIKDCGYSERRPLVRCGEEFVVPCSHPAVAGPAGPAAP